MTIGARQKCMRHKKLCQETAIPILIQRLVFRGNPILSEIEESVSVIGTMELERHNTLLGGNVILTFESIPRWECVIPDKHGVEIKTYIHMVIRPCLVII